MSLACPHCQSSIDDAAVDRTREIATCGSCGRIVDLQQPVAAEAEKPRMRDPVELPAGMVLTDDVEALIIGRRWLRAKHFVLLAILGGLSAYVAYLWNDGGFSPLLALGTLILVSWDLRLLGMFINTTTIRATHAQVDVRHGPVPSLMFKNQSVPAADIRQLFAAKWGPVFEVGAEMNDGRRIPLVRPVVSEEQAIFVEQRLEQRLGLVDFEVPGELGVLTSVPAPVSTGAGGALVALPLLIVPAGFLIFAAASASSVEGTLEGSGERIGAMTFAADDCSSGETRGFFGVELRSSTSPGTVIRPMRDPVRGVLIAVDRGGDSPVVLTPQDCTTLNVHVERTNTNINDVWGVRGHAHAECDELRGRVTFDGCY